jgi:hypothetical protein
MKGWFVGKDEKQLNAAKRSIYMRREIWRESRETH